ncbi:6196_t:CDS:2, partial [Dentiscutata heterogama]
AYVHHDPVNGWLTRPDYKCIIHGKEGHPYFAVKGDLASWIDGNDNEKKCLPEAEGKSTLSILELHELIRYIACEKVKMQEYSKEETQKLKDLPENYWDDYGFDKIKEKLIDKENTVIIIDEAHDKSVKNTAYQHVPPLLIRMDYKVLLMSATFEGKDFSISTTKPRKVMSLTKFGNQVKWEEEKHLIYFATTKDIYGRTVTGEIDYNNKILISGLKPEKRKMLEESGIPFVVFDDTNSDAISSITQNMPTGSIFLFNIDHEMGISPWARVLILTGETLEEPLGRGPSNAEKWRRANFVIRYSSLASMIQRIGRVGRMLPGWAFLLTLKLEETKPSKDVIYHLINGIIAPASENPMEYLAKNNYKLTKKSDDYTYQNFLRLAVALPKKRGLPIEVVIIGTTKDASGKYPIFNMKPDPKKDAGLIREEDLVYWHENESPQPPTINKENQKNIQLIMLENRLSSLDLEKQKKVEIKIENTLVDKIWDFSSSKRNEKGELIHEEIPPDKVELIKNDVWSVIKKVWQKKINEEKIKFKKSDQNLFKEYVGWYKFVNNLTINAERKKNSKGELKEECVIEINYKDKDLKQIRKEDIINYSLIKSIPETEYEICDRCNSFTLGLFEILCLRHDPLYIFRNLNFMAQLIKQGLDMELNLIIPKKEIDTEFYETLKTRIANEMDIDKLNNEYSKEIEERKPNLEEHMYHELHHLRKKRIEMLKIFYMLKEKILQTKLFEDLEKNGEIFNLISNTELKNEMLKNEIENLRIGKISELKMARLEKETYFTREINNSKNVQDLEDDEEAKFNKEISECDVFTKELKQKYKKMRENRYFLILKYKSILDQMKIDDNLEHFKDNEKYDRNQISHENNYEKIFNNYYSDKIQKSLNLSEYQENKLYTYLNQKIEEYNFYNVYLNKIQNCENEKEIESLFEKYKKFYKTFNKNMFKTIYENLYNKYLNISKNKYDNVVDDETGLKNKIIYEMEKTLFLPTLAKRGPIDTIINKKINNQIIKEELQEYREYLEKKLHETYIIFNLEIYLKLINTQEIINRKIINIIDKEFIKLSIFKDFHNIILYRNSFDYLEKRIKIQYNKCLYRNIENDLNHYSENIEYFENNNKYETKIHLLNKELVNENQIKSLNDKRIGNLKQFNTLSNKIIDMNHHKKRTIKLFMNIKEKIFLETDINKLENHIKQDIVWSDYQKGKLSEYTKHTLRNLDLYNKLKNQIINCEDIDEIEHDIMQKFKKISYTMNLKLKIDLFQHIENKFLNLHKDLDIINENNIEDMIKNETGYLLLNTRNVYDEKINSLIDDPISHTEYQKFRQTIFNTLFRYETNIKLNTYLDLASHNTTSNFINFCLKEIEFILEIGYYSLGNSTILYNNNKQILIPDYKDKINQINNLNILYNKIKYREIEKEI